MTSSSSSSNSYLLTNLLDQTTSCWRGEATDTQWFIIQLLKNSISLSRYSFWQYNTGSGNIVKSWIFEGSRDGSTWSYIDQRNDPTGICTSNSIHSFESHSEPFTFFRFQRIGSLCGGSNMHLYSFDIFGVLYDEYTDPNSKFYKPEIRCTIKCDQSINLDFIFILIVFLHSC